MIDIRELSIESQDGIAILIKGKLSERNIKTEFIPLIHDRDIHHSIFAANLESKGKKPLVGEMREHCAQLLPALNQLNIKILYITDSSYFGFLTGLKAKPAEYEGYALPCVIQGFEHMLCILGIHPYVCSVNPDKCKNQLYALDTLQRVIQGVYSHPGQDVIRFAEYPKTITDIADWLTKLHSYPELVCDIETFSLKHVYAGLGTIAFAWDKHSGIAFDVSINRSYREIRTLLIMLRKFFIAYQGKLTYHNMGYDAKQLIYMLFMNSPWDHNGMLFGLNIMTRSYDDTKIISYLATNSAAGNALGLKEQCKEFLGKYSEEDIKDITLIPLQELLEYNLKDCCGTWYVKEKNYPKMVHDEQLQIYEEIFKPAIKQIIQMELIGLPVNPVTVLEVSTELENFQQELLIQILTHPVVTQFWEEYELPKMVEVKNSELKTKIIDAEYFIHKQFNPNSHSQMARLLFDFIGFEVVSYTKAKQPSTDGDTLTELYAKALELEEHSIAVLLKTFMEYSKVNKIITAFIPPFRDAVLFPDGIARVFGNFNLGGTVSGRLSSSTPNLQNLPSNSKYGKLIKSCVQPSDGWLFVGLDFNALEDHISALTTKDENKLKVYLEGYDGHCLRAYAYFGEEMPDIDGNSVESINSIGTKYKSLRQDSKSPTFALTYQGTWLTLVANCGFTPEKAKQIEARYHELYQESDKWVQDQLEQASIDGYVTVAFGLRVRTPALHSSILNSKFTPPHVAAEGRTAGNALGQSYGLLNTRAANEFQDRVLRSKYVLDVLPVAAIHDANYYLIRNDLEVVKWVNDNLVECAEWQELEAIKHDQVKLGGELSIFYPSWREEYVIPNKASEEAIELACQTKE